MGRRLSAEEFEKWRVVYTVEQLHPADDLLRHAQLLAAVSNGSLSRRDRRRWMADDFRIKNPWSAAQRKPKPQPTAQQIVAQVAAINQSRRRH